MEDITSKNWPLCMSEAKKLVEELKLEYYSDPNHLTFVEALYLLRTKSVLGPDTIYGKLNGPWKLKEHEHKDKINKLLERSLRVQMSRIVNTEFNEFVLSNACLAVSGLLHLYLKQIGIESTLKSGVFSFSPKPDSDGTPHVWLEIDGKLVENTFVHLPNEKAKQLLLLKMKTKDLYFEEDLTDTKRNLFFGQVGPHNTRFHAPHTVQLYKQYGTNEQVEKYLVAVLKMAMVSPRIKMYDVIMRDEIKKEFEVVVPDLEAKWEKTCWKCQVECGADKLKTCAKCRLARYCSQDCQKLDWTIHKTLHKEIDLIAESVLVQ